MSRSRILGERSQAKSKCSKCYVDDNIARSLTYLGTCEANCHCPAEYIDGNAGDDVVELGARNTR